MIRHDSDGDMPISPGHMFEMEEDQTPPSAVPRSTDPYLPANGNNLSALSAQEVQMEGVSNDAFEQGMRNAARDAQNCTQRPAGHARKKGGVVQSPGLLKDQLKLRQVQRGSFTRMEIAPLPDQLSFDKGFYVFIRAIQLLTKQNSGVIMVGLAGPSGSGKTAFSHKVKKLIPGVTVLSMDNYNDGSLVIDGNFDDPRLTDYDCLLENLRDLRDGRSAQVPIYDFKTSSRVGYKEVEVPTSRVIILEGIYALNSKLRDMIDLRVSVTGGVHFDLVKRVLRDIDRSGQAPQEIIQQVSDTVYPMYKAFIEPDLALAHIRIYNTFNPFSGFMDATYILKSAKQTSQSTVKEFLERKSVEYKKEDQAQSYDIYLLPPGEDPETCQSWLRMRNREGRYNLVFEEWVTDGPFIISPRISFEVSVRILGGLMALGYEIGTIMRRNSKVWKCHGFTIKVDDIEGMPSPYIQIQGKSRADIAQIGSELGLDGTYVPQSYIEQVQINKLTADFSKITENLKREISIVGGPSRQSLDEATLGKSPPCFAQIGSEMSRSLNLREELGGLCSITKPRTAPPTDTSIIGGISSTLPNAIVKPRASRSLLFEEDKVGMKHVSEQLSALQSKLEASSTAAEVQALQQSSAVLIDEVKCLSTLVEENSRYGGHLSNAYMLLPLGFAAGIVVGFGIARFGT